MSLYLVESTHQEQLAEALVQRMNSAERSDDHLEPTTVVVQNAGLGRWLRLWHARHCGISAGVKMPFARSFIAKELEARGLFDRRHELGAAVMRWQIFELLQSRIFDSWSDAGPLAEYLSAEHTNTERRAWQLAGRLADLYDSYAVQRPEWLLAWGAGRVISEELPHSQWQAQLFHVMVEKMGLSSQDLDQRIMGLALSHYLAGEGTALAEQTSSPLYVFGIASFPPAFLKFFQQLGKSREVYLYHFLSSEAYLGDLPKNYRDCLLADLESGELNSGEGADLLPNPLLVANGQAAARFQSLLLALDFATGEMLQLDSAEVKTDLQSLQNSIRTNERSDERTIGFSADGSLSVHSCHSRMREVQVLQQQLLALFSVDEDLLPEDIMVLVPEISDYTDAINSVFSAGTRLHSEAEFVKIPFCIADQKSSGDENCWRFFSALLGLLKGRQKFSEVACLLDFDPICNKLRLDRDVLKELLDVLQDVGVRWGIDGARRKAVGFPEYEAYSWNEGLQRLYDGLLFGGDWGPSERAPYVTSSQMLEAVGELTQLLSPVFELVRRSHEERNFEGWTDELIKVLRLIIGQESRDGGDWMRLISNLIGGLQTAAKGTDVKIGFDTYCTILEESNFEESGPSGLLRRGVTFCRLQSARHIPKKVVCVLGLDEGSYPRQEKALEFDLLHLQARNAEALIGTVFAYKELHYLGDTHIRDEDRQLFLDCLLNAQERLYLSYVGQSDLNNSPLPPSLLVSELLQFLERALGKDQVKRVVVQHPLQDWSKENFKQPKPKLGEPPVPIHFNSEFGKVAANPENMRPFLASNEAALPEMRAGSINLTAVELLRFLKDPAKDYLRNQLHVRPDELDWVNSHKDAESLSLDGLEKWSLRKKVLEKWLSEKQQGRLTDQFADQLKQEWRLDKTLPLGYAGETVWSKDVLPIVETLQTHLLEVEISKSTSTSVCDGGHFHHEYWENSAGQRLIFINGDLDKPKYLLEAFIYHIGAERGSIVFNLNSQTDSVWPAFESAEGADRDLGSAWLNDAVALWKRGQMTALPFSLGIANAYVGSIRKDGTADTKKLLADAYYKKWETYDGVGQDSSVAQCICFDGDSPASPESPQALSDQFMANAECILEPVLAWQEQLKPKKGRK